MRSIAGTSGRFATMGCMPRSIWSGAISFGLVNVPVKLYSSVSRKTVRFHQLNGKTGHRIAQKRVDSDTGDEVAYEDIVKGYELTKDRYVVITPDELESLDPEKTRSIDIEDFVDLQDIDPVYYDHPYYLVPDKGASKAYGLLLHAMEEADKVAIARVVIRSKEQLVAIRPAFGRALMMETMVFADEVVSPEEIDDLPEADDLKISDRELKMAQQLIDSLSSEFEPEKYKDEYREKVLELIERKAAGEEIAVQPEAPQPKKVPDLMAALEASLAAVKGGRRQGRQEAVVGEGAVLGQEGRGVAGPLRRRRGPARTRRGSRRCARRPSGPRARARGRAPSRTGRVGSGSGSLTSKPRPGSQTSIRSARSPVTSTRRITSSSPRSAWRMAFVTSSETSSRASSSRRGERWSATSPSARRASAAESGSRGSSTSSLMVPAPAPPAGRRRPAARACA